MAFDVAMKAEGNAADMYDSEERFDKKGEKYVYTVEGQMWRWTTGPELTATEMLYAFR